MLPPYLSPTATKQSVLRARVNTDIEQAFIAVAKQRGMKISDFLRSLILTKVGAIELWIGNVPAAPENATLEVLNVCLAKTIEISLASLMVRAEL